MTKAMFSAVSGIQTNQSRLQVVANNIANVNTTAFKSSLMTFKSLFYDTISGGSAPDSSIGGTNPKQVGNGVTISNISRNFNQGGSLFTGRNTDLMIAGEGFFTIESNDTSTGTAGFLLTRAGDFNLDAEGYLVNSTGNRVLGTYTIDGNDPTRVVPVQIPLELSIFKELDANNVVTNTWIGQPGDAAPAAVNGGTVSGGDVKLVNFSIGSDGAITAVYSNGDKITVQEDQATSGVKEVKHITSEGYDFAPSATAANDGALAFINAPDDVLPEQLQVRIATVTNPAGLVDKGNNNFILGANSGTISFGVANNGGRGAIESGALESSNVDIAQEFSYMILSQRALEASTRVITSQNEVLRSIIGMV